MNYYHFGIFDWKNAGDTMLGQAVEDLIGEGCWQKWPIYGRPAYRNVFMPDLIKIINQTDAVIIGGGGFIIPGNWAGVHRISGWHFPLSKEQIQQITKPIIVFGLGFGRFWYQRDFNELFVPHMNQLIGQSAFFSMRNTGSMVKLSRRIDPRLRGKLKYQPDAGTILSHLYPEYSNVKLRKNEIALQPALDCAPFRFGNRQDEILTSIARAVKQLDGDIKLVLHIGYRNDDCRMAEWLDKENVKYEVVNLSSRPPKEVMDFYAGCPLTIGMRGHGSMIPFGMGNPFVPLISHDKVRFFLDDVRVTEGIYVTDPDLTEKIINAVNKVDYDAFRGRIEKVKKQLWQITQENLAEIRTILKR